MIIRDADIEIDGLAILDGAMDFASRTAVQPLLPDNEGMIQVIARLVNLENVEILLADNNNMVVGGLGIAYSPFLWNTEIVVAEELFWWTADGAPFRTAKMLFDEAMMRIEQRGAVPMFESLTTSPSGVGKVYSRAGLEPVSTKWMRVH